MNLNLNFAPPRRLRRWMLIALLTHLVARAAIAWKAERELGQWARAIDNAANRLIEDLGTDG